MGVVIAIILIVGTINYVREPNLIPTPAGLNQGAPGSTPGSAAGAAPDLADDRKVTEHDCTKPVDPSAGNLRCK